MPTIASKNDDAEPVLRVGQIFAERYLIGEQVGYGGYGAVFSAQELRLKRRVAIKVLHPKHAKDKKILRRFHIEAIASSRLNHPCIVKVYASGVSEDGTPFIAMEYIEGETFQSRLKALHLKNQRMSSTKALQLSLQAARVLSAAHDLGIYHRDLKPHNFMLISDEDVAGGERIKLLDFGIAKLMAEGGKEEDHEGATSTGDTVPGTGSYMPPEQYMLYKGVTGLEGRMDVYSLGVIMYLAHAGRLPLYNEDPAVMMGLTLAQVPDPLLKVDPKILPGVSELVQQMLAKDAADRPTMAQVRDRIAHLLGQSVSRPEVVAVRATAEHKAMLAKFSTAEQEAALAKTGDVRDQVAPEIIFLEEEADAPPAAGKAEKSLGSRSTNMQHAFGDLHMSTGRSAGQQITSQGTRDRRRRNSVVGALLVGAVLVTGGSFAAWRLQNPPHLTVTKGKPDTTVQAMSSPGAAIPLAISPVASPSTESTAPPLPPPTSPTPTLAPASAIPVPASAVAEHALIKQPKQKVGCVVPTDACISGGASAAQRGFILDAFREADIKFCNGDRMVLTGKPLLTVRESSGVKHNRDNFLYAARSKLKKSTFEGQVEIRCKAK